VDLHNTLVAVELTTAVELHQMAGAADVIEADRTASYHCEEHDVVALDQVE
jgi:hypothetical protein